MLHKSLAAFSPALRSSARHLNLLRTLLFSTSVSSPSSPPPDFLPSYLVTKCGFSPDEASKAAKLFPRRVRSPDQPDSAIAFFKSRGFTDSHLKRLLSTFPHALALSIEETLAPRFQTFSELGFTGDDLATLVCSNPSVLVRSMENQVVPMINLWKRIFGSHHSLLMKCLKQTRWQIISSHIDKVLSNISLLKDLGLSDHQISTVVSNRPYIIIQKPESLIELVSRAENLGISRGSSNFHWALYTLSMVSEKNLRPKVEFFKGFGWSVDDFSLAFRKSPGFFTCSSKVLKEKMEFLLKEGGCTTSYIALHPVLLTLSLEKRLIPRLKVVKALKEKGLSHGDHKLTKPMTLTKNEFFERYVAPYKEAIPGLSQLCDASS